jgi:uncharacterized membrane protein
MATAAAIARPLAALLAFAVMPLALHLTITRAKSWPLIVIIALVQIAVLAVALGRRHPAALKCSAAAAAAIAVTAMLAGKTGSGLAALPGIPHALAYSMLLAIFGSSLFPGRVPILTRLVQAVRGPLPPELVAHTRHVTIAWCCFSAAQLAISLVLFLRAPYEVWSFFVNILNLPLLFAMFAGELTYRMLRFRHYPLDRLSEIRQMIARVTEHGWRG